MFCVFEILFYFRGKSSSVDAAEPPTHPTPEILIMIRQYYRYLSIVGSLIYSSLNSSPWKAISPNAA